MCGLIGLAGDTTGNMKSIFTELLLVDVVRGHHSTGAAVVKRDNSEIHVAKLPVASQYFVASNPYQELMKQFNLKVMIGHNRYATIGDKTISNAHPFEFETVVGAHNGTIDKWCLADIDDNKNFGTDSEAIYYSIDKRGLHETVAELRGAWALTWFDKKNDTINFLRNSKRPLYYCYSKDRSTIFWASEPEMLKWILCRNNVVMYNEEFYTCDPDMHYRWEIPKKLSGKFDKPTVIECKEQPKRWVSRNNTSYWHGRHTNQDLYGENFYFESDFKDKPNVPAVIGYETKEKKDDPPVEPDPPRKAEKVIDTSKFRPPYKDHLGRIINKNKFKELVAQGCVFCDVANQEWGDFIKPLKDDIEGRKIYLCEGCYNDEDIRELVANTL